MSRSSNFSNGVPEVLIFHLLSQKAMYGYEIVSKIQVVSKGVFAYGEGYIYPLLHSLEEKKFIRSRQVEENGRQRTYYELTRSGRSRFEKLQDDWSQVKSTLDLILGTSNG